MQEEEIFHQILEKWHYCSNGRYRILLITLNSKNQLIEAALDEVSDAISGVRFDFYRKYKGQLDLFFTWQQLRDLIYEQSKQVPVVVSGIEPFYSKWPVEERLSFLKNLLRLEPAGGIILALFCSDNLMEINAIAENNRGLISAF
jgi:hypothetical protein